MTAASIRAGIAEQLAEARVSLVSRKTELEAAKAAGNAAALETARARYALASGVVTALEAATGPAALLEDPA